MTDCKDTRPYMTLPNGDVIYEGEYARTRDGRKVGPAVYRPEQDVYFKWEANGCFYTEKGVWLITTQHGLDLVAKWVEDDTDLTQITTPFGLLDEDTKARLKAWPHGLEVFGGDCWREADPAWLAWGTYRAKPAPNRGTLTITGAKVGKGSSGRWSFRQSGHIGRETHSITIDTLNGEPLPGTYANEDGDKIIVKRLE